LAADSSVVKLSPKCFVEPYNYTQQIITDELLRQFKNYLRNQAAQTSLTVVVRPAFFNRRPLIRPLQVERKLMPASTQLVV